MRAATQSSVHGGIRHLEIRKTLSYQKLIVHGGIRHLEKSSRSIPIGSIVHGGIRHLEKNRFYPQNADYVHGGIRHLEIFAVIFCYRKVVHGGIRHLESVPIFRVGDIGIISSSKSQTLNSAVAGSIHQLDDVRISYCELEDQNGIKVPYDQYVVDYDYGKVTLGGDFVIGSLVTPLIAKYRYQDMGLINDVQIDGRITFTKPVTHNYDVETSVVGSALVIGDMQSRYTSKFVQGTWNNIWDDVPSGGAISANYNDALYPFKITNKGAIQERWSIVFTDVTTFRCIGEVSGQIATGAINTDFAPINPTTGLPYFTIKKEGWGSGWANGNVLRFNTIACMFPVWCIRCVKQSEPSVLSDQFQIMLRGDIDRVI